MKYASGGFNNTKWIPHLWRGFHNKTLSLNQQRKHQESQFQDCHVRALDMFKKSLCKQGPTYHWMKDTDLISRGDWTRCLGFFQRFKVISKCFWCSTTPEGFWQVCFPFILKPMRITREMQSICLWFIYT